MSVDEGNVIPLYHPGQRLFSEIDMRSDRPDKKGVRTYSSWWGWILQLFGYASKIPVENSSVYVNKNSLGAFLRANFPDFIENELNNFVQQAISRCREAILHPQGVVHEVPHPEILAIQPEPVLQAIPPAILTPGQKGSPRALEAACYENLQGGMQKLDEAGFDAVAMKGGGDCQFLSLAVGLAHAFRKDPDRLRTLIHEFKERGMLQVDAAWRGGFQDRFFRTVDDSLSRLSPDTWTEVVLQNEAAWVQLLRLLAVNLIKQDETKQLILEATLEDVMSVDDYYNDMIQVGGRHGSDHELGALSELYREKGVTIECINVGNLPETLPPRIQELKKEKYTVFLVFGEGETVLEGVPSRMEGHYDLVVPKEIDL